MCEDGIDTAKKTAWIVRLFNLWKQISNGFNLKEIYYDKVFCFLLSLRRTVEIKNCKIMLISIECKSPNWMSKFIHRCNSKFKFKSLLFLRRFMLSNIHEHIWISKAIETFMTTQRSFECFLEIVEKFSGKSNNFMFAIADVWEYLRNETLKLSLLVYQTL